MMPTYIIQLFALFGFICLLLIPLYLIYSASKKLGKLDLYLISGFVIFITAVAVVIIIFLDGDLRSSISTLFVGAFATIGWMYTLSVIGRHEAARSRSDEQIRSDFISSISGIMDAVLNSSKKDISSRLIIMHSTDQNLERHRNIILRKYPNGVPVPQSDIEQLRNDMSNSETFVLNSNSVAPSIQCILNFYEGLAYMIKHESLDEEMIKAYFSGPFRSTCNKYKEFIDHIRYPKTGGSNAAAYSHIFWLAERWFPSSAIFRK